MQYAQILTHSLCFLLFPLGQSRLWVYSGIHLIVQCDYSKYGAHCLIAIRLLQCAISSGRASPSQPLDSPTVLLGSVSLRKTEHQQKVSSGEQSTPASRDTPLLFSAEETLQHAWLQRQAGEGETVGGRGSLGGSVATFDLSPTDKDSALNVESCRLTLLKRNWQGADGSSLPNVLLMLHYKHIRFTVWRAGM